MKTQYKLSNLLIILLSLFLFSCQQDMDISSTSETGVAGSTARFAVKGDYLYTVTNSGLKTFDITNETDPIYKSNIDLNFGIETIYPYKDNLFIGTQTGMYIYSLSIPNAPSLLSRYEHIYSCGPVVVDDNYAYVTLRSENSWCGRFTNELQIVNITDLKNPYLEINYQMSNPKGLGINGTKLFICDEGIKVYDVSDIKNIQLEDQFPIETEDVILKKELLALYSQKIPSNNDKVNIVIEIFNHYTLLLQPGF